MQEALHGGRMKPLETQCRREQVIKRFSCFRPEAGKGARAPFMAAERIGKDLIGRCEIDAGLECGEALPGALPVWPLTMTLPQHGPERHITAPHGKIHERGIANPTKRRSQGRGQGQAVLWQKQCMAQRHHILNGERVSQSHSYQRGDLDSLPLERADQRPEESRAPWYQDQNLPRAQRCLTRLGGLADLACNPLRQMIGQFLGSPALARIARRCGPGIIDPVFLVLGHERP